MNEKDGNNSAYYQDTIKEKRKEPEKMKVIDVSTFNGAIDWNKVADACDGVIIRCGYRGYSKGSLVEDTRFKANIAGAKKAGLPIGLYFVTQAISAKEAIEEARFAVKAAKGYKLALPIYIDSEDCGGGHGRADAGKLSREKRTEILKAFCEEIENKGFTAGIYASESWFKNLTNIKELQPWSIWVAKYSQHKPEIHFDAWQYTSDGHIAGVSGRCDVSEFSLNAPGAQIKPKKKKDNETIADEVIAGKWGDDEARKTKLEKAGYNYKKIQTIVNRKLKTKKDGKAVYYTVKRGDTLTEIASKYDVTVKSIANLNKIADVNKISVGQKLRIK